MKYNKQLFDNIQKEYNQLLELAEFIYDQLLNDQTDNKRYETLSNLDLYVQGLLANIILDNDPKNPALFNMMKKLTKYDNFYQGINLDDWFHEKDKVLKNITKKKLIKRLLKRQKCFKFRLKWTRNRKELN